MPRPRTLKPAYCLHGASGRAFVKIDGKRIYLGSHGTQESRDAYDRAIGEWIARGRMPAPPPASAGTTGKPYRVTELIDAYWQHVQTYYVDPDGNPTSEVDNIRQALRPLKRLYGNLAVKDFGPKALRAVRELMIAGETPVAGQHEKPKAGTWSRKNINKHVGRLRGVFKWGVARELVPASIYHALVTLEPLKQGRTTARETEPVRPVAQAHVDAILPYLSTTVKTLVQLQQLTGARGGELCIMRTGDIDRTGDVWSYVPRRHKTQHHGHARVIRIGPKGQEHLRPLLKMDPAAFIFSPADADRERRDNLRRLREEKETTSLSCGNGPGDNVKSDPDRKPGNRYTKDSYARAVARACDAAFPPPDELARQRVPGNGRKNKNATRWETDKECFARLGDKVEQLKTWQRAHRFHPHQLRHSAATFIAAREGVEMARVILGHRHLNTTAIYAEADQAKAADVMRKIG